MKKIMFNVLFAIGLIILSVTLASLVKADYLIYFKGMDKHAVLDPMKPYVKAVMLTVYPVTIGLLIAYIKKGGNRQ